jgi:hypothetical protein
MSDYSFYNEFDSEYIGESGYSFDDVYNEPTVTVRTYEDEANLSYPVHTVGRIDDALDYLDSYDLGFEVFEDMEDLDDLIDFDDLDELDDSDDFESQH